MEYIDTHLYARYLDVRLAGGLYLGACRIAPHPHDQSLRFCRYAPETSLLDEAVFAHPDVKMLHFPIVMFYAHQHANHSTLDTGRDAVVVEPEEWDLLVEVGFVIAYDVDPLRVDIEGWSTYVGDSMVGNTTRSA